MIALVNKQLSNIEQIFNLTDTLGIMGIYSGILRTLAGQIQQIAGVIFASMGALGMLLSGNRQWTDVFEMGTEQIIHGALNILRGFGTAILGLQTGGLGNLFLLIPNLQKKPPFTPFFHYGKAFEEIVDT